MARKKLDWHWPRTDLADHYVNTFTVLQAHAVALFAPRGKGKTEFMTRDVMPAAAKEGFFPVYVNFWDEPEKPVECFRYGMVRAAGEANVFTKLKDMLSRVGIDLSLELNVGVATVGVKPSLGGRPEEVLPHFAMRQVLDHLHKIVDKPILFVFDEVQTLASKPEHEKFVRSFRTMLDERRGDVYSIFTGSSQARLTELFARIKAPFYNFAQTVDLPPLDDRFLLHWTQNIRQARPDARAPELAQMREAFALTDKNPRIFFGAVMSMLMASSVDIMSHTRTAVLNNEENAGIRQRLQELTPLDRLVLANVLHGTRLLRDGQAQEPDQIFSKDTREQMRVALGLTPTPTQIQSSLRRLMSDDMQLVVSKQDGHYQIEDEFFMRLLDESLGLAVAAPAQLPAPSHHEEAVEVASEVVDEPVAPTRRRSMRP